jgi:hypothetical protein
MRPYGLEKSTIPMNIKHRTKGGIKQKVKKEINSGIEEFGESLFDKVGPQWLVMNKDTYNNVYNFLNKE